MHQGERGVEVVDPRDHLEPLVLPVDGGQKGEEAAAERLACAKRAGGEPLRDR